MNIIMAWRNIWRNKKRTFITISSVTLAVVLAVFMRSFQEGTYAKMIENAVGNYTGYVQVHQKDYWLDKSVDNGLEISPALINQLNKIEGVEGVNARLETFSLASYKNNTKGTLIMGIDPFEADKMLHLKDKMIQGSYFSTDQNGLVLGSKLAAYLNISIGDTLVLMGQGHWGNSAIAAYPVHGILKMPIPDIDRQIVFMPLSLTQDYLSFPNGATSLIVLFQDASKTQKITDDINANIDNTAYLAMSWQKMSPEIVQQIEGDKVGGIMMIAILYMIIAFGVFGTVLMMAEERKKEFAVMIAIGMQKTKLILITFYETILMNSLGVIIGVILTIPIIIYFNVYPIEVSGEAAKSIEKIGVEPIMPTILRLSIFVNNVLVILVITGLASIYPLFSIFKLSVIKSLKR